MYTQEDIKKLRELRRCINSEFDIDIKISDSQAIEKMRPYAMDSDPAAHNGLDLYELFLTLSMVESPKASQPKPAKVKKLYRGREYA